MSDRNLRIQLLFQAMDRVTKPLRDIAGGATRTGQNLRAMRDRLKEIDAAQADIGGFRQLKAGVRSLESDMQGAQGRVAELARQMAAAETPTKKLATEFARAKREAAALKAEHTQESAKLQQLRDRMTAAGISTSRLADHERELRTEAARTNQELTEQARRLKAVQDRSARFAAGREQFSRVQGTATGLAAGGASGVATGLTALRPILAAEEASRTFQSRMTDIELKTGLSASKMKDFTKGILGASRHTNQLPDDMQRAADILAGLGMKPGQILGNLSPIGKVATSQNSDVGDISKATFAVNDNLKVPIQETTRALEVLTSTGKSGGFELKDMAREFPVLTAAAQALGQKGVPAVADLGAALQVAFKAAGDGNVAATNVQNLLQKMNAPDTIKNFKKMGVDLPAALKRAYAEGKTPLQAIADLTNKTLNGDLSRLGFLFGDMQAQNALRPLIQNMEEYQAIKAQAMNSGGMIDRDFARKMEESAQKAKKLEVQSASLRVVLGGQLSPTFDKIRDRASSFSGKLAEWAERNPRLSTGIALFAAGLAGLFVIIGGGAIVLAGMLAPFAALSGVAALLGTSTGPLMLRFGQALLYPLKIFPLLGRGAMMLATTVARAGLLLLANPMILAIVALVAVVGFAGYMIWKHWDTIKAAFFGAVGAIGSAVQSIWGRVTTGFTAIMAFFGGLGGRFTEYGRNLIMGLIRGVTGMLGALKSTIINAASSAANWFKNKLGIRSPSRVFMSLGGFVMDGLTHGIAGGEDAPIARLDGLAKRMATAMAIGAATPAVAAPALSSPATSPGVVTAAAAPAAFTINIYGAPGQSPQDLARAVRAELEKVEREKRARGNSSYADAPDWSDR